MRAGDSARAAGAAGAQRAGGGGAAKTSRGIPLQGERGGFGARCARTSRTAEKGVSLLSCLHHSNTALTRVVVVVLGLVAGMGVCRQGVGSP